MLNLPSIIIDLLNPFAPCFYGVTTWMKAQVLLIGAILTPGKRVVTEALRVMGLSESATVCPVSSGLEPGSVVAAGIGTGVAETAGQDVRATERARWCLGLTRRLNAAGDGKSRRGASTATQCAAATVISSKPAGLRWISLMLLTPIPWAQRIWALPVMTVLAPSERYYQQRGRRPQTMLARSAANAQAAAPLAARASPGSGRRQCLCGPGFSERHAALEADVCHPLATGRCLV